MKPTLIAVAGGALTLAAASLCFVPSQLLERFSNAAYDALLRATAVEAQSDDLLIVDLDEESLQRVGQWPWPRFRVARLAQALLDAGAKVVVFDVLFAEPDRTSPAQVARLLDEAFGETVTFNGLAAGQEDYDAYFARTLRGQPVVLGCSMRDLRNPDESAAIPRMPASIILRPLDGAPGAILHQRLFSVPAVEAPLPVLAAAAAGIGSIDANVDSDNVLRRSSLLWSGPGERLIPSLALESLRVFAGTDAIRVEFDAAGVRTISTGGWSIPVDAFGRMTVNYRRPIAGSGWAFPVLSAHQVVEGSFDADLVAGRIAMIGTSATGLLDIKATPLRDGTPGVETHAVLIDNILAGDILRRPAGMALFEPALILLIGLALTWSALKGRAWVSMLAAAGLLVALPALAWWLMARFRVVLLPAFPVLSVGVIYPVLASIRYWQEESQRRRVRQMFGAMVSKDVMNYLEENPETLSLEGRDVDATIFFSDIAGFTTIAEQMTAGEVTNLLNRYLSAMNEVIIARKGYVDKYQGDAIMAVWGAPFAVEEHAREACLAALEQMEQTLGLQRELKERFGVEVQVRMGINSGRVKAGNMGSRERMQYTVIGDVVNQAARFEPLNKQYGTGILMGESTYILAGRDVEARLVDRIVVKGKTESVDVYELLCRKGQLAARDKMFIDFYETALRAHWKRDWDTALAQLDRALAIQPADVSCLNLRMRVQGYMQMPPALNWSGAFIYTTK